VREVVAALEAKALYLPNVPLPDVPAGAASANRIIRAWGTPRPQAADVRPHWELGERLGIVDLPRGAKLAGSGFPVFVGSGARLTRALIQLMLELHTREHGYIEVDPPFVVRREVMQGTGQLPKFEDDAYRTTDDLFLVPTAEVPLTNLYKDEILDGARLPIALTAYPPCFRREAERPEGHARPAPGAPVRQGGAGADRASRGQPRCARGDGGPCRARAACARAAVSRGAAVQRRHGLCRGQDL
jgi:seryl-tRNA synthetase